MKDTPNDSTSVPWNDVVRFVRQLSHDLRNHLNAAELQAVYLNELAEGDEMKAEIKRLREMIAQLGTVLQKLSADLAQVKTNPISYGAADFVEDMRKKVTQDFAEQSGVVQWDVKLKDEKIEIDPQLLQQAVLELFANAFQHPPKPSTIKAQARVENGRLVFALEEEKPQLNVQTDAWGREPFGKVNQGHYGLGLNRVRAIVEAHGGEFRANYDSPNLITTITLPLS
jgi:two-component system, OmpR family, lantibiotic biosynthesis sensor histidine kinase NisK/SpaK